MAKLKLTPQNPRSKESGTLQNYGVSLQTVDPIIQRLNSISSADGSIDGLTNVSTPTLSATTINELVAGSGVTVTSVRKPIISAGAATLAPTIQQSGSIIALAKADGTTVTLPACSVANIGVTYKFQIAVSSTGGVFYVINTTGSDVFLGGIYGSIAAPGAINDAFFGVSTANKRITLNATTTGGLIGGWVEVTCVSGTQWMVTGVTLGTGTIATPFSN